MRDDYHSMLAKQINLIFLRITIYEQSAKMILAHICGSQQATEHICYTIRTT